MEQSGSFWNTPQQLDTETQTALVLAPQPQSASVLMYCLFIKRTFSSKRMCGSWSTMAACQMQCFQAARARLYRWRDRRRRAIDLRAKAVIPSCVACCFIPKTSYFAASMPKRRSRSSPPRLDLDQTDAGTTECDFSAGDILLLLGDRPHAGRQWMFKGVNLRLFCFYLGRCF